MRQYYMLTVFTMYESKAEDGNVVACAASTSMKAGEAIAVVGPSGSGNHSDEVPWRADETKRWLGKFGWEERLTGQELVQLRQKTVSFIFQEGNLLPDLNGETMLLNL